jgi:hypothetical protein
MAEYIRFRWTRAKAGVTMAFLALLGGLADRAANAEAAHDTARTAAAVDFFPTLTLNGLTGSVKSQFVKLDKDLQTSFAKYDKVIATLSKHVVELKSNVYDKLEANATFLSKQDAGKIYMKDGSEAANSAELGGLTPSSFLHGAGGVATGTATATLSGGLAPLVTANDGSLIVQGQITGNGASVVITNSTANAMTWIATIGGQITDGTLAGDGGKATLALASPANGNLGQATVQLLPAVQNQAFTLTVSTEEGQGGVQTFVGQMVNGDG